MKTAPNLDLNAIYAPVESDLADFSSVLKKELSSNDALITDIHNHILKMTGKFLRPALTLLCSKLGDSKKTGDAVKLAVAIELIHTATLIHDDIIDNSDLRRNMPSVHSKWGREISIVSGDYLYAKSFLLLASLKNVWLNEAMAMCAHVMCEGEMKQIEKRTDFFMSQEQYFKIIHQKTAALFQASCMGGAFLSGLALPAVQKLGDYGYNLGMAFQIVDDCLDIVGETKNLGKTAGLDVYKNDVTLPLLYLFSSLSKEQSKTLLARMNASTENGDSLLKEVKDLIREHKSVELAMAKAREFIENGLKALEASGQKGVCRDSLENLAHFCLERAR